MAQLRERVRRSRGLDDGRCFPAFETCRSASGLQWTGQGIQSRGRSARACPTAAREKSRTAVLELPRRQDSNARERLIRPIASLERQKPRERACALDSTATEPGVQTTRAFTIAGSEGMEGGMLPAVNSLAGKVLMTSKCIDNSWLFREESPGKALLRIRRGCVSRVAPISLSSNRRRTIPGLERLFYSLDWAP